MEPSLNSDKEIDHGVITWSRVDAVVKLILDNPAYLALKRNSELVKMVCEQIHKQTGKEISERTAERYIKEAKSEIRKIARLKHEKKLERALINLVSIIQRCRKSAGKDELSIKEIASLLKVELATLTVMAELEGLYPEKNVNVKGHLLLLKNFDPNKYTEEQLQRLAAGEDPLIVLSQAESKPDVKQPEETNKTE